MSVDGDEVVPVGSYHLVYFVRDFRVRPVCVVCRYQLLDGVSFEVAYHRVYLSQRHVCWYRP